MKVSLKILMVFLFFSFLARRAAATSVMIEPGIFSASFVTVPNEEVAKKIAHGAVSEKLAACVNIIPKITSVYMWEGKIQEDSEYLLIQISLDIKTPLEWCIPSYNVTLPYYGQRCSRCMKMLKTRTSNVDALTKYVKENHPYKVCEVISMKIDDGNPDYFKWISEVVPA